MKRSTSALARRWRASRTIRSPSGPTCRSACAAAKSLTLGWQLVDGRGPRDRRYKEYKHIPTRNGTSDYDPLRLYRLARPHERDLVVAVERRAVGIRKAWAAVVAVRTAHRMLSSSRPALNATIEPT